MEYVFLNSGGKDSLAAMMLLAQQGHTLRSVYVEAGQRTSGQAQPAALAMAEKYAISHEVCRLEGTWLSPDSIIGGLAYQSALLHVLAASYGVSRYDIYDVASGQTQARSQDPYITKLVDLLSTSPFRKPPTFTFPVWEMDAASTDPDKRFLYDIVKADPLWKSTVSCNFYPPCGECNRCLLRAKWLEWDALGL